VITAEEVFDTAGKLLGPYLKRVPDGEVGGRRLWISWQAPLLRASPFLEVDTSDPQASFDVGRERPRGDVEIRFGRVVQQPVDQATLLAPGRVGGMLDQPIDLAADQIGRARRLRGFRSARLTGDQSIAHARLGDDEFGLRGVFL